MLANAGTFALPLDPDFVLAELDRLVVLVAACLFLEPGKEKNEDLVAVGGAVEGGAEVSGGGDTGGGVNGSVFQCWGGIAPMSELRFLTMG